MIRIGQAAFSSTAALCLALTATGGCGSQSGPTAKTGAVAADRVASRTGAGGTEATMPGTSISADIRVDNFGWRPADRKVAVLLGHAGVRVELRSATDNAVAGSFAASAALANDEDSGDAYAAVNFSAFANTGDYYLSIPSLGIRSYQFRIADDVYDVVGAAAVKSYYYQRCNHNKVLPYATDALGGFPGRDGKWIDGACHMSDSRLHAGPGSVNNGTLDVHGGWHDAGDYQKTLWGRGVPEMLFAYEINPSAWTDGQLNLPESGNGIPDLLDEIKWEIDFYVRMQRPDGHFMSSTKGRNPTTSSPPSQSDEKRVYFDCTSPTGNGWSGGGVTIAAATGNAVLSLAHAAIVLRKSGQSTIADGYAQSAALGWAWLNARTLSSDEQRLKAAAAAAVFRMDPKNATAKAVAEAFAWDSFDGQLPYSATPAENVMSMGAYHCLSNASASSGVQTKARAGIATLAERAFEQQGAYGGMFGGPGNGWDWSWGSNRHASMYGANLMMAAHFGAIGSRTAQDVAFLAQKHFHYMLGLNPLNMVYLTNMAAYGGEHSSFQIFHDWFSFTGNDGDHGNTSFNGKPIWVDEPLYPYYVDDKQTSTFGPAPGLIPGGPNPGYAGSYVLKKDKPAYAYRDFSVACDSSGGACRGASWEITEPMAAYQGPFVLLVSFMMRPKAPPP
jgi:endoglucanase